MKNLYYLLIVVFIFLTSCNSIFLLKTIDILSHESQIKWLRINFYEFFSFNIFTTNNDKSVDEDLSVYSNEQNCIQYTPASKTEGIISKHLVGFCLWPLPYSYCSVKNRIWKDGKVDTIKELSKVCDENELEFGVSSICGNIFYTFSLKKEQKEIVVNHELFVSNHRMLGKPVAEGGFLNIKNNLIKQYIFLKPRSEPFVELRANQLLIVATKNRLLGKPNLV